MQKLFLIALIPLSAVFLPACLSDFFTAGKPSPADQPQYQAEKPVYQDLAAAEAKALIDAKPELIIIDVSSNYADGHLPGAVNYCFGDKTLDNALASLDKDREYLVYCHEDTLSILGAQKLVNAGFQKVYRLQANYQAWVDAGYPVEK